MFTHKHDNNNALQEPLLIVTELGDVEDQDEQKEEAPEQQPQLQIIAAPSIAAIYRDNTRHDVGRPMPLVDTERSFLRAARNRVRAEPCLRQTKKLSWAFAKLLPIFGGAYLAYKINNNFNEFSVRRDVFDTTIMHYSDYDFVGTTDCSFVCTVAALDQRVHPYYDGKNVRMLSSDELLSKCADLRINMNNIDVDAYLITMMTGCMNIASFINYTLTYPECANSFAENVCETVPLSGTVFGKILAQLFYVGVGPALLIMLMLCFLRSCIQTCRSRIDSATFAEIIEDPARQRRLGQIVNNLEAGDLQPYTSGIEAAQVLSRAVDASNNNERIQVGLFSFFRQHTGTEEFDRCVPIISAYAGLDQ